MSPDVGLPSTLRDWLTDPMVIRIIVAVVAMLLVITGMRLLRRVLGRRIQDADTRYRTRKFITFGSYVLALVVLAFIFSDKLGGLNVALGLAGAGIAFALQELIVSIAGWFTISLSGFFGVGDRIKMGGIKGDVIDIGMLRTTLMEIGEWVDGDLYSGRVVRVANSFVYKEPVFNYSGDFPFIWDEITVPIRHESDRTATRELLEAALSECVGSYAERAAAAWRKLVETYRIEDARVEPMVTLSANENWRVYTLRYVVDYRQRRTTKSQIISRVLEAIEASAGQVILATSTLEVSLAHGAGPGVDPGAQQKGA